jgi:hypothetical protein
MGFAFTSTPATSKTDLTTMMGMATAAIIVTATNIEGTGTIIGTTTIAIMIGTTTGIDSSRVFSRHPKPPSKSIIFRGYKDPLIVSRLQLLSIFSAGFAIHESSDSRHLTLSLGFAASESAALDTANAILGDRLRPGLGPIR